ncbi:hypothetical protein AURDEDRAFT_162403 [Auricularia subglabra TFB-10046 SS5]|nr:hypothetical protein AURDEDRAFT_162403 [Auricularia subglabra TFB-10046 SS5]
MTVPQSPEVQVDLPVQVQTNKQAPDLVEQQAAMAPSAVLHAPHASPTDLVENPGMPPQQMPPKSAGLLGPTEITPTPEMHELVLDKADTSKLMPGNLPEPNPHDILDTRILVNSVKAQIDRQAVSVQRLKASSDMVLKILSAVEKVHPFVGVVVVAVKVAIDFEVKRRDNDGKVVALKSLMLDLAREINPIETSISKTHSDFLVKFEVVSNMLKDDIIKVVHGGPHERIINKDIAAVWEYMHWREGVKARHFVIAVRDYFYQKYKNMEVTETQAAIPDNDRISNEETGTGPAPQDIPDQQLRNRWAIEYISLARIESMLEAIDEDASGWISVVEANAFTSGCPSGYSVLEWLAYWASGFRIVSALYGQRIVELRAGITELSRTVQPGNLRHAQEYSSRWSWRYIDCLVCGVIQNSIHWQDYTTMEHFKDIVQNEERRLERALASFKYYIDGDNALQIVTNTPRIELYIFPLLYLVLKHHLDIIQRAQSAQLRRSELVHAMGTIETIAEAVQGRVGSLDAIFAGQRFVPKDQFSRAYDGMFSVSYKLHQDAILNTDSSLDPLYRSYDPRLFDMIFTREEEIQIAKDVTDGNRSGEESDDTESDDEDPSRSLRHPILCDKCGQTVRGLRYRCLECKIDTSSLDFCSACVDESVDMPEEGIHHLPSHDMMRTQLPLGFLEESRVLRVALEVVVYAAKAFGDAATVYCIMCKNEVARPCWHCAECPQEDAFLCDGCGRKELSMTRSTQHADGLGHTAEAGDSDEDAHARKSGDGDEDTRSEKSGGGEEGMQPGAAGDGDRDSRSDDGEHSHQSGDGLEGAHPDTTSRSGGDRDPDELGQRHEDAESSNIQGGDDASRGGEERTHEWWHFLVKVQQPRPETPPPRSAVEEQIAALKDQLEAFQQSFHARLDELRVEARGTALQADSSETK